MCLDVPRGRAFHAVGVAFVVFYYPEADARVAHLLADSLKADVPYRNRRDLLAHVRGEYGQRLVRVAVLPCLDALEAVAFLKLRILGGEPEGFPIVAAG